MSISDKSSASVCRLLRKKLSWKLTYAFIVLFREIKTLGMSFKLSKLFEQTTHSSLLQLEPLQTRGTHKVRYQDGSEWDFYLDAPHSSVDMSVILPHYRARHQPVDHRMSMFVAGDSDAIKVKVVSITYSANHGDMMRSIGAERPLMPFVPVLLILNAICSSSYCLQCRHTPGQKFYLEVLANSSDVTLWLPSDFKGQIYHTQPSTTASGHITQRKIPMAAFSSGFVNHIMRNTRFNETASTRGHYSQDDVVVVTGGKVTFRMWDVKTGSPEKCHLETLKRFFGCSKKAPETVMDWDCLLKD